MTAPARRAEDRAIDARQAQTARAFGSLLDDPEPRPPVRLVPVAPHVHAHATERAAEAVFRALDWLPWDERRPLTTLLVQGLATLPLDVDPREAVQRALYRADQRCALRAGMRVAPVLRAYCNALDEHARVIRADVMCRGVSREDEAEAVRCEGYAAGLRERTGL